MATQLPTRRPEGTPDYPQNLLVAMRALAPDWRYRIVRSCGTTEVREPIPERRLTAVTPIGNEKSTRKTRDVRVLLKSISLRCQRDDGVTAYAYWTRPLDGSTWTIVDCGIHVPGETPQVISWAEFRDGTSWTELEAAA